MPDRANPENCNAYVICQETVDLEESNSGEKLEFRELLKLRGDMFDKSRYMSEVITAAEEERPARPVVTMSPTGTTVQEVHDVVLERNGEMKPDDSINGKQTIVETSDVIDCCGCPVNLKAVKDVVKELPEEYKEAAVTSSLVFASLAGLFFSVVLYRYFRHLYTPQPEGFFCGTFAWIFAPLFDALCETNPPGGFFDEMHHESSVLFGELEDAVANFFHSIFDGFHAMGTIFSQVFSGITGEIDYGIHELLGNVCENVSFLFRFSGLVGRLIFNAIAGSLSACAYSVSTVFHAMSETAESASSESFS